jgi:hypothetical protein
MLPARLPKRPKRSTRWRSQAHLSFVRKHLCSIAGCDERPIEAAHVRNGSGAGIGQKPDDWRAVSLCKMHHTMQHTAGERSFWKDRDVEALIAAFIKASPKRAEIERIRKERENG